MESNDLAPVALFMFNRPALTARVFEHIRASRPRRLLVVADGPRRTRPEDAQLCETTRKIVRSPDWPCELLLNFSDENLGCRRRLSTGLDWVFDQCPEAIILEDDCLPCPSFFSFCSAMLSRYRDDARIMHVSGDNWQGGVRRGTGSYYFSRYSLSWGWASWRRAWRHYDVALSVWPAALKERWLASILDDPLEIEYWTEIFDKLYRGEIDTWDYQWLFTCWAQNGLSIHPNENLVTNIGVGPDALNFKESHSTIGIPTRELDECVDPVAVIRDKQADRFTFEEHIAGKQMRADRTWVRRFKKTLAIRARIKNLLRRSPA
jgi:hypothetical protein